MPIQSAFTLNPNAIFNTLGNMIIAQFVRADNIGKHQTLVDEAKTVGSMFGDKILRYDTDALPTFAWGGDSEAANLLSLDRPADPAVQEIVLDKARQIRLTVDHYLTKQAFMNEGSYADFMSVMLGWMRETKKIYEGTMYNVFVGTEETSVGKQQRTIDVTSAVGLATGEEANRLKAAAIAQNVADLLVDLSDYSRDYNDYQYIRSYAPEQVKIAWNASVFNEIEKRDLSTYFHKDGLIEKLGQYVLPARYFGIKITASNYSTYSASTPAAGKPIDSDDGTYVPGANHVNGTLRSAADQVVTVSGTSYALKFGDELPAGAVVYASSAVQIPCYIEDNSIAYKAFTEFPPLMSGFEVGTNFPNPRALVENHYLTWLYNTLVHIKGSPFITARIA